MRQYIPFTTLVFGMLLAWAFLTIIGFAVPDIFDPHTLIATGAAGALMAYVFELVTRRTRLTRDVRPIVAIRRGCLYAGGGYTFFVVLVIFAAVASEGGLQLKGCFPALISLAAFGGLGILGGFMYLRFRRVEAARQDAALATQELEIARDLQQRLLPPPLLETDRYRLTAKNVPAAFVAGDFYDFIPLTNDRIVIVLADVSGKGVAAGLLMASAKAILPVIASDTPDKILRTMNERLAGTIHGRDFIAVVAAIYDANTRELSVANAGMPDPVVVSNTEPVGATARFSTTAIVVEGPRYPIGVRREMAYVRSTVLLHAGDRVIFFSDGLPEAAIGTEPLGYDRLANEIRNQNDLNALFARLDAMSASHDDDWTAVMLEI